MLKLKNIELVSIDGVSPELACNALMYSAREISFASIKLLSFRRPHNLPGYIQYIQIPKLSLTDYQRFSIKMLDNYIQSDYCLSVQPDGFVINPRLWDTRFLEYDYIGAAWRHVFNGHRVGNSGFCLRSKKFLEISRQYCPYQKGQNDDIIMATCFRDVFESRGCSYAPVEVAMHFSIETSIPECEHNIDNSFGFHGNYSQKQAVMIEMLKNYNL